MDIQHKGVENIFQAYPDAVRLKMLELRRLVIEVAEELGKASELQETLKWGEPSYLVKGGSTIRMDWKEASPDHYALYFNCNSKLVETFKEVYGEIFEYQGNRALVLKLTNPLPLQELKHCVAMAMEYQKRKYLPLLGA